MRDGFVEVQHRVDNELRWRGIHADTLRLTVWPGDGCKLAEEPMKKLVLSVVLMLLALSISRCR